MGYQLTWMYIWNQKVRPTNISVENYVPQMTANTQDWFTATCSTQINSSFQPRHAFFVSTEWGTNHEFHSSNIWSWNRAWSEIELPEAITVNKVTIWARKNVDSYNVREIRAFNLLGSNDGNTWTNIHSESWLWSDWNVGTVLDWNITWQTDSYTYLKLEIQANRQYVSFDFWNISWTIAS